MSKIIRVDDIIAVKALGDPENKEAYEMLASIVNITRPIIHRENLCVGSVEEFYPTDSRLLGLNEGKGRKIKIKLRRSMRKGNTNTTHFYPITELIGTLIHELVHCRISNHSKVFYRVMSEWSDFLEVYWQNNYMHPIVSSRMSPSKAPTAPIISFKFNIPARKLGSSCCVQLPGVDRKRLLGKLTRELDAPVPMRETSESHVKNTKATRSGPKANARVATIRRLQY